MARQKLTAEQIAELFQKRYELVQLLTTGASQVSHDNKSVSFRSPSEIKSAIDEIDRLLSGEKKTRIVKVYYKRGV